MTYRRKRSLRVEFKPADCWVGVFWKRSDQPLLASQGPNTAFDVWVCLLPMLPIHYSSRLTRVFGEPTVRPDGGRAVHVLSADCPCGPTVKHVNSTPERAAEIRRRDRIRQATDHFDG